MRGYVVIYVHTPTAVKFVYEDNWRSKMIRTMSNGSRFEHFLDLLFDFILLMKRISIGPSVDILGWIDQRNSMIA